MYVCVFFVLKRDGESTGGVGGALQCTFRFFCSSLVRRVYLWVNHWDVKVFDVGRYSRDIRFVTDVGGLNVGLLCQRQAQLV